MVSSPTLTPTDTNKLVNLLPKTLQYYPHCAWNLPTCTIPWEESVHFLPLIFRTTCLFDKRVVISRFHCSVAIQGIMLHISFPTYIQYTVLSTRNFIPNWFNKRTSLLQACTFIQSEAKTEPVKKRTNTKTQKAVISMPPLISSQKVMLLIGHNTINASCLSYLTFSIL